MVRTGLECAELHCIELHCTALHFTPLSSIDRMQVLKGVKDVTISSPMEFKFTPSVKREAGHWTATLFLRRMMEATFRNPI